MHYTVLVLGENVEELLAPYDENMKVEPYVVTTAEELVKDGVFKTISEVYDYYGDRMDEKGNVYTTYNPNSKWDWYSVGGRWTEEALQYGATVGETNWKHSQEYLDERKQFWKDWVLGENRERFGEVFFMYKPEYYLEKYKNLENFLKANTYRHGYAILTPDGVWHEPGRMGWFSSLGEMEDELDFEINAYDRCIKNLPPETPVTFVDCHI